MYSGCRVFPTCVLLGLVSSDFAEQLRQAQLDECAKSLLFFLIVQPLALCFDLLFKLLQLAREPIPIRSHLCVPTFCDVRTSLPKSLRTDLPIEVVQQGPLDDVLMAHPLLEGEPAQPLVLRLG